MKVAILGYYYQNNAGDDRILDCLTKKLNALGVSDINVFIAWDELTSKLEAINSCDYLLVGGGGLILRNTNRLIKLFENITIPWAFIGVSIDSVGEDNLEFIKYIAIKAKFIVVRDTYSYEVFNSHRSEDLYKAPDITFLYPYESQGTSKFNKVAVSLRPWRPNIFKQYTRNYHRFNKLVYKLPFIVSLLGLWDVSKFMNLLKSSVAEEIAAFPLQIHQKNGDDQLLNQYLEGVQPDNFDINQLSKSDYLVGMRLHALIFATQLGKPFIAVSYASKIDNYLSDIESSELMISVNNYKALPKALTYLNTNYDDISDHLNKITDAHKTEVHQIVDDIYKSYMQ